MLDLQHLYKVREYCDIFNKLVIMSFNTQNPETAALAMHPAAFVRVPDASLPHLLQDPNPALTLALHHLWASLRRFCTISGDRGRFHAPGEAPNLKIADALLEIRDPVVSFCLSCAKFSTNDHIFLAGLRQYSGTNSNGVPGRLSCPSLARGLRGVLYLSS